MDVASEVQLLQVLRRFTLGPSADLDLRALLGELGCHFVHQLGGDEVLFEVARRVRRGDLTLHRRSPPALWSLRDQDADAAPEAPRPREAAADTTWIEIELVEHDGKPVGNEPYEVIGSDGSVLRGSLDGRGFARVEGLPPGTCTVVFPRRDRADWDGAELVVPEDPGAPPRTTWMEIELVDDAGSPVPNERFSIFDGDREVARGRLDGAGVARVEGLPDRACTVVFPWRDATDVEVVG